MTHDFVAEVKTFWITHGPEIETGELEAGHRMSTGRPYFETYSSPRQRAERIAALRDDYPKALAEWLEVLRLRDPLARLADYRWKRETGGLMLPNGIQILTEREAQAQISTTLMALSEGMVSEPIHWKTKNGWVRLYRDDLRVMGKAIAEHVDACFKAEEIVSSKISINSDIDIILDFEEEYSKLMLLNNNG